MREITVISGDLDGAALRRAKKGDYLRCDNGDDNEQIQEAIGEASRNKVFTWPKQAWERVFGGDKWLD